jgi:hypothetical protein
MSFVGQDLPPASQQSLFDHLVGDGEKTKRNREP